MSALVALAVLGGAQAQAGTLTLVGFASLSFWSFEADDNVTNAITIERVGTTQTFSFRDTADSIVVDGVTCLPSTDCGCTRISSEEVRCPNLRSLTVAAGNQNDSVKASADLELGLILHGEGGADTLVAGEANDIIDGGGGADLELTGGDGTDTIRGGTGADKIDGGTGIDTLSFAERTTGVTATLAPPSTSDGDQVASMEALEGSGGDDTLTASSSGTTVSGLGGADTITGGAGFDTLRGGAGEDVLNAIDGAPDSLDCGDDADRANLDLNDAHVACEVLRRPDSDGDGFDDATDCAPADPLINPARQEVPDNAADENCDGILAFSPVPDRDGDGFDELHDCDDTNAAIRPGALERPGNAVDENCDALRPDFPVIASGIAVFLRVGARVAKITELSVTSIPAGGRVVLRCRPPRGHPKACPFRRVRRDFPAARRKVDLTRAFKGRRLRVGTVLDFRVLAPDTIGKVRIERIARFKTKRKLLCLRPGAARPAPCP